MHKLTFIVALAAMLAPTLANAQYYYGYSERYVQRDQLQELRDYLNSLGDEPS